jgi:DNA-binding NtrC family response regulator
VRRVGSNQVRRADVRIIAATNRSLAREVERGRFREDLYYRLAVIQISLPPLRERPEDIAMLISHFTQELGGPGAAALPEAMIKSLTSQTFPGNVRELRNLVARALSLRAPTSPPDGPAATTETGQRPMVSIPIDMSVPLKVARDRLLDEFEQAYLREALALTSGNVTRAADLAGVNRKFIQRAMRRLGLREDE